MALIINTNLGSINGQRNLNGSSIAQATAMQRLSSGVRVNNAKDDAAGLAIADRMTSQVRGMTVAVRNANDGISLTQTAEGALGSLTDTLQRMRDLAIQSSSNAAVSDTDREKMNTEFKALNEELIRVVQNSEFNGKKILNGDLAGGLNVQVGASTDTNSRISIAVSNMTTLLTPVTSSTLSPNTQPMDSTLASTVANNASAVSTDPNLKAANDAAKLANLALVAARAAAASPNDVALARAASTANALATAAVAASSTTTLGATTTNQGAGLVSQAFVNSVTASAASDAASVAAIAITDANIQAATVTDSSVAAAMLTTATQLVAASAKDISAVGENILATTMFGLTGDTIAAAATTFDGATNQFTTLNPLNDAVNRGIKTGNDFGADREAQKALVAHDIARAIATASYVNDPTKTDAANETDKQSFVNNNKSVIETSMAVDRVSTDYALASVNFIDAAIATIDTERSNLGSTQNRFTTTIANLQNGIENQSAAKSRIMDADFAQETAALSRAQILQQAGTAMLAQANQSGQSVMALLR